MKNYPKSPKAPDAMFKVGVIMQDKGDTAKAKAVYQQVINKFPGTDGAKQAQKRLNAMLITARPEIALFLVLSPESPAVK